MNNVFYCNGQLSSCIMPVFKTHGDIHLLPQTNHIPLRKMAAGSGPLYAGNKGHGICHLTKE